ncbi:hypothetical protein TUM2798_46260 (plasmid) [Escherichia coli]|nr:hypothetical protein TUM2798_46260 [Escherichia coli]
MKPNRPLIVILSTVALDAVGIGLIMPVLPGLLRDLVHSNDVTAHYGILLALYALMQFACAPVLGALSDRFGRRPVLLVSLAGAAVDYAIMATAPFLWVLYIGRIVAGITGATGAVAGAYIADRHCCKVSDEAAFCLIQRPYISKTLLTRRISPRGSP